MKHILLGMSLCVGISYGAISENDVKEFKAKFQSKRLVLSVNKTPTYAGSIDFSYDTDKIQVDVATSDMPNPVTTQVFGFPLKDAELHISKDKVTLDFESGDIHKTLIFKLNEGYADTSYNDCDATGCRIGNFLVSLGGAPGTEVDAEKFFKGLKSSYPVDSTGATFEVDLSDKNFAQFKEGSTSVKFVFATTKVFLKDSLFFILAEDGKSLYEWEDRASKVAFRNFPAQKEIILSK